MTDENLAPAEELPPAGETAPAAATEEKDAEIANLKDQILRALADAENTRRRSRKEIEDSQKFAVGNFAKEMLVVADNFRRALDAVPQDKGDPALKNFVIGIEATERQMISALERFGIKKLSPLGQMFNPNFHQVMAEIQDPSQPAGTIVQVLQDGYTIHDRLLREALVAVAKGGGSGSPKINTSA
jgi:molecular chaperone GrpE